MGFIKFIIRGTLCAVAILIIIGLIGALMDGTGCQSLTVDNYQPTAENVHNCGCF